MRTLPSLSAPVASSRSRLPQFVPLSAYVLRVPSSFRLVLPGRVTLTCKQAVTARLNGKRSWEVRSAGTGSKGQRWYAWAWLGTASPRHHLLIRRHLQTGELAFQACDEDRYRILSVT